MKQTWKCSQCLTSLMSVFGYRSGLGKGPVMNGSLACASSGGMGVFQGRAQWEEVRSLRQSLEGILRSRPILLFLFLHPSCLAVSRSLPQDSLHGALPFLTHKQWGPAEHAQTHVTHKPTGLCLLSAVRLRCFAIVTQR